MSTSLATMRNSSKETRRNRKRELRSRIRKVITGSTDSPNFVIGAVEIDIAELVEIARIEGIQQGYNEYKDKYGVSDE